MKGKFIIKGAALAFSISSALTHADLSTLNVDFQPDATHFYSGETIGFSLASDGTDMQYRYVLEHVTENGIEAIEHSRWTSNTDYQLDTTALNLSEGKYRLRVISRERANKEEVLVKYNVFNLLGAQPSPCESFAEGTYSNATATPYSASYSSLSALFSALSSGLNLTTADNSNNVQQLTFTGDAVQVQLAEPISVSVPFYGSIPVTFNEPLSGSYTCADGTISVNATGNANANAPGSNVSVTTSFQGNLSINGATGDLEAGGATFQ